MKKLKIKDIYLQKGITNSLLGELSDIEPAELYEISKEGSNEKEKFVKQMIEFLNVTEDFSISIPPENWDKPTSYFSS